MASGDRHCRLVAAEHRVDVEQPEPCDRAGPPLDAVRIGDRPAEHLVAAAEAEHPAAAPVMGEDVDVPALLRAGRRDRRSSLSSRE